MLNRIITALKATAPAPLIQDKRKIDETYKLWRRRVLISSFIGYGVFYLIRKNISIALPALASDLGYSNIQLGLLGTLLYITYGVGKFTNGILGDKANPRYFIVTGLVLSALMNIFFGMSTSLWSLAIFWSLNGWFQSMGLPPCIRLLANWFSVSEKGTMWSIWHISHQVGGVVIAMVAGVLIQHFGWRSSFYLPAIFCLIIAIYLFFTVRDIPPSMGLPNIADYRNDIELNTDGTEVTEAPETVGHILVHRVLTNKYIWLISIMNIFVYVVRFGTFDWATKFLVESKGSQIGKAGFVVSMLELFGILGPIFAGVLTDKLSKGRRGPMCAMAFLFSFIGIAGFYFVPAGHPYLDATCLGWLGFWIYGPQFLVGVFASDFSSRKAAATAVGFTGVFGYAGSAISGVGSGWLIDKYGWGGGFVFWGACAIMGAIIAATMWNACPVTHKAK